MDAHGFHLNGAVTAFILLLDVPVCLFFWGSGTVLLVQSPKRLLHFLYSLLFILINVTTGFIPGWSGHLIITIIQSAACVAAAVVALKYAWQNILVSREAYRKLDDYNEYRRLRYLHED